MATLSAPPPAGAAADAPPPLGDEDVLRLVARLADLEQRLYERELLQAGGGGGGGGVVDALVQWGVSAASWM